MGTIILDRRLKANASDLIPLLKKALQGVGWSSPDFGRKQDAYLTFHIFGKFPAETTTLLPALGWITFTEVQGEAQVRIYSEGLKGQNTDARKYLDIQSYDITEMFIDIAAFLIRAVEGEQAAKGWLIQARQFASRETAKELPASGIAAQPASMNDAEYKRYNETISIAEHFEKLERGDADAIAVNERDEKSPEWQKIKQQFRDLKHVVFTPLELAVIETVVEPDFKMSATVQALLGKKSLGELIRMLPDIVRKLPTRPVSVDQNTSEEQVDVALQQALVVAEWQAIQAGKQTILDGINEDVNTAQVDAGQVIEPPKAALPEIEDPTDRRIWEWIKEDPSITDAQLAQKLGITRQAINPRRRALEKMGYKVRVSRQNR